VSGLLRATEPCTPLHWSQAACVFPSYSYDIIAISVPVDFDKHETAYTSIERRAALPGANGRDVRRKEME